MVSQSTYEKLATGTVWLVYFTYGIASSLMNTTLIDLAEILEADVGSVSYGLLTRAVFHCIGAPLFSWTFTIFNREAQYALSLALFGLGTFFTASSSTMPMFITFNCLAGLATSGIDIASYVWLLEIWKENANPYLQAMGGFWAVGQTLAALITRPYLSSEVTIFNQTDSTSVTKHIKTQIQIPYKIMGIIVAIIGGLVLLMSFKRERTFFGNARSITAKNDRQTGNFEKSDLDIRKTSNGDQRHSLKRENSSLIPKTLPKAYYVILILLAALMINFQLGLDLDFFNFLHTYAVQGPTKLDKSDASYLVSLTGLVQVASRFAAIFISIRVRPGSIITTSILLTSIGIIILTIIGSTITGLWIGSFFTAIGLAPVGASIYSFLEERIDVTNGIAGILTFSSTLLSTSGPYIVGNSIGSHPFIFILYILICNISVLILHIMLNLTDLWKSRYLDRLKAKTMVTDEQNNISHSFSKH